MQGRILKMPDGQLYGVGQFFATWQQDALGALSTCPMGDRDSYPGQYISRFIEEDFLDRADVEQIMLRWLNEGRYKECWGQPNERFWPYHGFEDIVAVAVSQKMMSVLAWLVNHFDYLRNELRKTIHDGETQIYCLTDAVTHAPNFIQVWPQVRDALHQAAPFDLSFFQKVYLNPTIPVPREKANNFLVMVCKQLRRYRRKDADHADRILEALCYEIMHYLGYTYEKGMRNHGYFATAHARASAFLDAQSAHLPFPLR
jgi:hypothetical protein